MQLQSVQTESMQVYRDKSDWISPSSIKGISSPKEYLFKKQQREEKKKLGLEDETIDTAIGTVVHCIHLEPEKLKDEIAVFEFELSFKTKIDNFIRVYAATGNKNLAYNQVNFAWSIDRVMTEFEKLENYRKYEFLLDNKDKLVLDKETFETCKDITRSMEENIPNFKSLLSLENGYVETSFYTAYLVNEAGDNIEQIQIEEIPNYPEQRVIKVKGRPDYVRHGCLYVLDIKTCMDASSHGFAKTAGEYEYFVQAAMYLDMVNFIFKEKCDQFYFPCCEKKEPYFTNNFFLSGDDEDNRAAIEAGRRIYKRRLIAIKKAQNENIYPGLEVNSDLGMGVSKLKIPYYYFKDNEKF